MGFSGFACAIPQGFALSGSDGEAPREGRAPARFIEEKNLSTLIEAYAKYRRRSEIAAKVPWDLVLLGDGPLRETLSSQVSTLNLNEHVHLPGFEPYDELPVYYALASAFV